MPKFKAAPEVTTTLERTTMRLGSAAVSGKLNDNDLGKFVKLGGDSQYTLCASGDPIEGVIVALDPATQDGWSMGTVQTNGRRNAVCDGSQAAGTGSITVGSYVVCGTVVAANTALASQLAGPKVRLATNQPGAVAADLAAASAQIKNAMFAWRVISLGNAGAVGDTCVIERVNL